MKNKRGFTLIELIVSVVLVSVVLVALIGSLLQLRNAYTVVHENSDVIVYTSSISRVINSDINQNNGIKYVSCEPDGKKCSIILGNDERRELIITENDKILDDVTDTAITHSNSKTTLKYLDTTIYDKSNNEEDKKIVYIRTLELDKYENESSQATTSSGYNFYDMSANQYEYFDPSNNNIDAFTTLTIRLLDGINLDLSKYNITLYGAGRYDYSQYIGKVFRIDLNNSDADTAGTTSIDEVFGVGFFVAESAHTKRDQIKKIDLPTKSVNGEPKVFKGYFYQPYGNGVETQIIDASGNIFASSRTFKNDVILNDETTGKVYAKWGDLDGGYRRMPNGKIAPNEYNVTLDKKQSGKTCNTVGTNSYTVLYDSMVKNIEIPQCAGYTFEGYLDAASKTYHDRSGKGIALYDKIEDSTFTASWHACSQGQYSLITQNLCNDCVRGSYSNTIASGSCTPCQNGKTTNNSGSTSCDKNCSNNNDHVLSWVTPTWNESTNTITNECKISSCKTGYDGQTSSNTCVANSYTITFNLNGGKLNNNASPSNITATYDATVTIANATKTGYQFNGWTFNGNTSTAIHGTTAWTSGTSKTKETSFKNLTAQSGGTVTMTANWGACPAGTFSDGSGINCTTCPVNTYNPNEGASQCSACPGTMTSPQGSTQKTDCSTTCPAGTYLKANTSECVTCPANSYCSGETYSFNASSNQGINGCPSGYPETQSTGASSKTQCRKVVACSTSNCNHDGCSASGKYNVTSSCTKTNANHDGCNVSGTYNVYTSCSKTNANHDGCNVSGTYNVYTTCSKTDANHDGCNVSGSYSTYASCTKTNANHDGCNVSGTYNVYTSCSKTNANHDGCNVSGSYSTNKSCSKTDCNHSTCNVSGTYNTTASCSRTNCNHSGCSASGTFNSSVSCSKTDCNHSTCSVSGTYSYCSKYTGYCDCKSIDSSYWEDSGSCGANGSTATGSCTCRGPSTGHGYPIAQGICKTKCSKTSSANCSKTDANHSGCSCSGTYSKPNSCTISNAGSHTECNCSGSYTTSTGNKCTKTNANHSGCTCTGTYSSSTSCSKTDANHDGCSVSGSYVSSTPSCSKTDANHDGCSVSGSYVSSTPSCTRTNANHDGCNVSGSYVSSTPSCSKTDANHDGCSVSGSYVSSTPSCTKSDANHDGCNVSGTYVSSTPSCTKSDANHTGCTCSGTYFVYSPA